MGNGGSPTGFGALMSPFGLSMLLLSLLLLVAAINLGSAWVKNGEAKARAERAELKKQVAAREAEKQQALSPESRSEV